MSHLLLFLIFFNLHAETFKDFTLPIHSKNESIILSKHSKDKKTLINFWASWCTSCIQELPQLEALKQKYEKEANFIAINAGEKNNLIDKFLKKYSFSYLILNDIDRVFSKSVGVESLPITIVVDKNLNIIYRGTVPPKEL